MLLQHLFLLGPFLTQPKFEEVFTGFSAPLLRYHAPSAAFQHSLAISACIDATLPHLDFLVKLRYPSPTYDHLTMLQLPASPLHGPLVNS
jgi:hypothetical protein